MTPQADIQLRKLLEAYADTLFQAAPRIPRFKRLRRSHGKYWGRRLLPTVRWGLTFLLVNHMTRTTARLRGRYQSLAAKDQDSESHEAAIKRIELFEASLPNASSKRLLAGLLAASAFVAIPVAELLFKKAKANEAMSDLAAAVADANPWDFIQALLTTGGAWACAILALTLYLLVLLPLTAFRWQRMMFARYPEGVEPINDLYVTDFNRATGGIYDLQRDVFRNVGASPVREIPWEFLGRGAALVVLMPLWLLLSMWASKVELPLVPGNLSHVFAGLFLVVCAAGAILLHHTWRKRNLERPPVPVQKSARASATPGRSARIAITDVASLWPRAAAQAVDFVLVAVLAVIAAAITADAFGVSDAGLLVFLMFPVAALVYSALTMLRRGEHHGQTFGKQIARVRLVKTNGEAVGVGTVLLRECILKWTVVLGIVSIYTLFAPLIITVVWAVLSKSNRPPHDLLARTIAVYARVPSPARPAPLPRRTMRSA